MTTWGNWSTAGSNSFRIGWDAGFAGNSLSCWVYIQNQYNVSGDAITLNWSGSFGGSTGATITAGSGGQVLILATAIGTQAYNSTSTTNFSVSGLYNGSAPTVQMVVALGPLPPNPPTLGSVTRVSDSSITVNWTNNPTSDRPYDNVGVVRRTVSGNYGQGWLAPTTTTFSDSTGISADNVYSYHVEALNAAGQPASAQSANIYTTPTAPTTPTAVKTSGGAISIAWTTPSSYASSCTITIEESQNGGSTWANLVTGLAGNSTSYTHTAPSTGVSHTYRIKEIAPSALSSTSPVSNTVTLLSTPNAPTPIAAPSGLHVTSTVFDAAYATTFSWVHNPNDATPQAYFEVSYQVSTDGGTSWGTAVTTGKVTSTVSSWTAAANTFTNGTLRRMRWQVRTWGAFATQSAYSVNTTLTNTAIPVAVVTSAASYTTQVLAATGTYSGTGSQTGSKWTLRTPTGTIIESATFVSTNLLSYTFAYSSPDSSSYVIAYQNQDAAGLWSNQATKSVTVTFAQPPTPTIMSLTFDIVTGKVTGVINNPAPGGGQVAAVSNRVYRDGVPVAGLLAVATNGTFIDSPPLNSTVVYSVYATSSIPSFSAAANSTVTTLSSPLVQVLTAPSTPAGWYVDGVDLSTLAFNIENRSAGWSMPAPIGENIKVPGRSGSFWVSDKPFDETGLDLNMWAVGATPDGLVPKDSTASQQCLRNLDGLSSLFGQGRLLEVKRSSSTAEEGLINRVINPSLQGASPISDWTDLLPGWNSRSTTSTIYNYFNNPNMSTLSGALSKYTDATRTPITVGGASKYAAVKTASGTGALTITLTGSVTSSESSSWVVGSTLWGSNSLAGNIDIQVQLRSSATVTFTSSVVVQYVRDKVFYTFVEPPFGTVYDNYVITFTTDSVTTGTTFGLYGAFFNSARAWTQAIAGDMATTPTQTYTWGGVANDSVSWVRADSKLSYKNGNSPRIVDGQDIGASLSSVTEYSYAPYLALAGPNNQEITLSVDTVGKAGQWLYFDLEADLTRTAFSVRLELWNAGNLVTFQPYGITPLGPSSFATDGLLRAPAAFSQVVIRLTPFGAGSISPQFYIGGQKIQINHMALMLESDSPILTPGYVPRYFPSEQLTNASVSGVTPRDYNGYMLVVPQAGPVSVSLTNGTTTQGPYTITDPTLITPAWSATPWTYSVAPNGNFYHLSTGYRASDATTLPPPMWDGRRFIDSPVWNSNKQISNTSGWINVLSNAVPSASAYLPVGTSSYTYQSPLVALEPGTTRISGGLTITPLLKNFYSISSLGVKTSTSYTLTASIISYVTAAGGTPVVLDTKTVTSPTSVSWLDVPISTGFAGVKVTLSVTSPIAVPFGSLFYLSQFMLATTPTTRSTPLPYFDGDTSGCSWTGTRFSSPSVYGGSIRRAMAEVSDAINFSSMAGGSRAIFNVAMKIPTVFWEDPSIISATVPLSLPANTNYEVPLTQFSGSTAPIEDATVQITILTGTTGTISIADKATNATLVITNPLVAGSTITIVGGTAGDNAYSVIDQDGNSLVPYLTRRNSSRFLPLTPMTPIQVENAQAPVLVVRSAGVVTATITVTGHRKFFLA